MSEWNPLQIDLAYALEYYDRIYEMPERPPDHIIDNDALLEQWMKQQEHQRRKADIQSKAQQGKGHHSSERLI